MGEGWDADEGLAGAAVAGVQAWPLSCVFCCLDYGCGSSGFTCRPPAPETQAAWERRVRTQAWPGRGRASTYHAIGCA